MLYLSYDFKEELFHILFLLVNYPLTDILKNMFNMYSISLKYSYFFTPRCHWHPTEKFSNCYALFMICLVTMVVNIYLLTYLWIIGTSEFCHKKQCRKFRKTFLLIEGKSQCLMMHSKVILIFIRVPFYKKLNSLNVNSLNVNSINVSSININSLNVHFLNVNSLNVNSLNVYSLNVNWRKLLNLFWLGGISDTA